jgi:D-amino peptidase
VKVFVISDMEGISGIATTFQTNAGESLYEEGRRLYTEEINAACGAPSPPARPRSS